MSDYVKFFRDTSPYINAHRGKTLVIALSGEAIQHGNLADIIHDIALLNTLGVKLVLVHGARPQVAERLASCGITPRFSQQTRITDQATMSCVKDAVGNTRFTLEALLSMGLANSPMHGSRIRVVGGNFITAKPLGVRNGVDFHHTGEVRRIDRSAIQQQLEQHAVVLVSPLGYSPTGEVFNLTLEEVAAQIAISLQAEKLVIYCSDDGIRDSDGELQKMISLAEVNQWLSNLGDENDLVGALHAGYLACQNGVPRCHLIGFQTAGALVQELFTRDGAGTLILRESQEIIRQATIDDVGGILTLIAPLEEKGILVKRSRELLETEISRFQVMVHPEGMLVACIALYPLNGNAGELACVAIHPDYQRLGLAKRMLGQVEKLARQADIQQLFALTTQAAHWFIEQGFTEINADELPSERKVLYNLQRNSKVFRKFL